ncbi:HNH endonuclease [Thalassovita autumnalis]|uniref:HNH endonuclease n=2 Tax=Thalassovita autumnalis TaxID=2072972 RepID=A0A0P1FXL6_9RHOB|nr:HNH endonuclease [Thalassovita autumnalis]CUH73786.1 HNH endonuclease [Thalassovita autumnalis]
MSRDHIPAALQRDLMIEAGYRCAVCRTPDPLEFEHIEDYAKVQKHEFSNMIVLCSNCHARKSDKANPRRLDRKALKQIKMDLAVLNGRYSDLERRIIQEFAKAFEKLRAGQVPAVLGSGPIDFRVGA